MKPVYHATISVTLSGILYMIFNSWGLAISSLISGIFIDLDYVVDIIIQNGSPFKFDNYLNPHSNDKLLTVRLFHGWEWVIFLGIAAWLTAWNPWVTGTWIGFGQHILADNINYGQSFWSYSFVWRWKRGFRTEKIFTRNFKRAN